MSMTTRKLLLSTAVLLAGVGVASAQGIHEGTGAHAQGQAITSSERAQGSASEYTHGSSRPNSGNAKIEHGGTGATVGAGGESHSAAQIEHRNGRENAQGSMRTHEHNRTTRQATHEQTKPGRAEHNAQNSATTHSTTGEGNAGTNGNANANARGSGHSNAHGNVTTQEHNRTTGEATHQQAAPRRTERNAQHNARTRGTTGQGNAETRGNANNVNVGAQGRVGTHTATQQSGNVELTAQQRTHIQQSVLSASNVPRLRSVGFALNPGVVVPESVHYVAISEYPTLVNVFPAYRDDYFFVAEDEIIVLTPQRRIVAVVPMGGGPRYGAASGDVELSSAEIRDVQQVLIDHGYNIQVDGVWGPATRQALISFQEREGLPATGAITAQTVTSLGLQGKIAESHIQRGAATTGSGVRENTHTNVHGNQSNAQQQGPNNNQAAQTPQNRATTGRGEQSNAPGTNRPGQNRTTNGQGANQLPQNNATNGQSGNQSTNGRGAEPQNQSTTGQSNQPNTHVGGQQNGASGTPPTGNGSQNNNQMNKPQE